MLLALAFALSAAAAAPDDDVALLSGLITAELAKQPGVEVVASADVRTQLELEGNRQALGCDTASASCLAELAGAMGTRLVVSGTVGRLGSEISLQLSLFDSTTGTSPGRVVVRAPTVDVLTKRVPKACKDLLTSLALENPARAERAKLLVLDLTGTIGAAPEPPPPEQGPSLGLIVAGVGGGVAALGGVLLGVSGGLHLAASNKEQTQKEAAGSFALRDITGWAGLVGLGLGVGTAAVGGIIAVGE